MKFPTLATGLSLALAMSACSSPQEAGPRPDFAITADSWFQAGDKQTLTDAYKAAVAHFVGKGITRAADVKLVLLEGTETFRCDIEEKTLTANDPTAVNCAGNLVITATFFNVDLAESINQATDDPQQRHAIRTASEQFVVAHEFGHVIQDIQGASNAPPAIYWPSREPQADCYGGQFMQAYAPGGLQNVALLLKQFTQRDKLHGTPAVRIGAMNLGVSGSECTVPEIIALRDSIEAQETASPQPQSS